MAEDEKYQLLMQEEHKLMDGYIDTAKTFTQLCLGALVLSITFIEKVLGMSGKLSIDILLLIAWLFWLLGALSGAFYQYRAVKWLEGLAKKYNLVKEEDHAGDILKVFPYKVYGFLLISFYCGTTVFAVYGIIKIF